MTAVLPGSLILLLSTQAPPPNKISCFISTCISLENLILSVRQEPTFGPWKESPFLQQECWSGLPCSLPENLPNSGIRRRSPALQGDSLPSEPPGKPKNTGVGSLSPSPEDLSNPGIELGSPALQVDSLSAEPPGKPKCVYTSF